LLWESAVGRVETSGARTISSPPDASGSSSRDVRRAEGVQSRDRQPAVANAGPPSCAIQRYRIFNFKALSGGNGVTGGFVAQWKCKNSLLSINLRRLEYGSSNQGVRGSNPFGRTFYQKKSFGSPGREIGNEQIEPLTDNKTVRLPGAAPGWTSPLQWRRSGAKRRTSGAATSNPSGRSIQIWSKPPISWLDGQLGGRPYIVIRQLVKVRTVRMSALMIWYCRKF